MAWLALLATLALRLAAGNAGNGHAHPQGQPAARHLAEYSELTNTTELPVLGAIDKTCGRLVVIWCAVKKAGEAATIHDSYLKVSVLSVLEKAPSVVPVLLFDGVAEHPLATWMRDVGGIVIMHALSFKDRIIAAATDLNRWQASWIATFFYFDIGLVAGTLRARTKGMGVDLSNVLHADVDTIFMADITSCSLPSPRILAAAGETTKHIPANAGVLYINLTAWEELHPDFMRYGQLQGWHFANVDQTWLFDFFGDRVSMLPDTYNWKPYWGLPQAGTWGRAPAVKILHIHGPKLRESVCVLRYLRTSEPVNDWNSTVLAQMKEWCKYERPQYSMILLLNAHNVDGGRLYSAAQRLFHHYLAKARGMGRSDEYRALVPGA